MSDITKSFKNVFISQKNSGYLFELIITKILQNNTHYKKYVINHIDIYKSNIIDLQSFIFEDNFANVYNEMKSSDSVDLEQILILLNQITIVRFENLILDDLYKKYIEDHQSHITEQIDDKVESSDVRSERERSERERTERIRTERERETRERETRESEARERETRESEARESEARESEAREREARESETRESGSRESGSRESGSREREARESETRERETRESGSRESGSRESGSRESSERKSRERKSKTRKGSEREISCDLKNVEKYKSQEIELSTVFHHLFSKHAVVQSGRYNYRLNIENVGSINLDSINILYNMYNINEYNNKMYLIEQNNKVLITIPVGYYSIDQLLIVMSALFNNASINKNKDYKFHSNLHKIKNKIFFSCELNEKEKFKRNVVFGMSFIYDKYPKNDQRVSSLQEILGFEKSEYINNTTYVTENPPNICIFEDLYVKIFVNDIELKKYNTSDSSFSYYQCLNVITDSDFGKVMRFPQGYSPYDIYNENYIINTISFEFYNSHMHIINTPMRFDTVLSIDVTESFI